MTTRNQSNRQCAMHRIRRSEHRHISQKDKHPCDLTRDFKDR